ncbi:endolytic transglycosylase MltG [Thermaurantimonas aggregans]|uniref:endolytic transglycosylase MltG n=1 Tax=Thermaurantimonas aggregans TaxID=2173829 RepID=UPI0023F1A3A8|nr:endolytic transglycosylase MltG [Thermaurantimonas aggregans]MCX8148428.1 endolytic transglycosylase MltG [Thermaurantimonas aggregans]
MKFFKYLFGVGFVATLAALAFYFYVFQTKNIAIKSFDLYISTGAEYSVILDSLKHNGVLKDIRSFDLAARLMKYPTLVKPGKYHLTENLTNKELINMLRTGRQVPVKVIFNNISFFEELSKILSQNLESDSATFLFHFNTENTSKKYGFSKETFPLMFIPDTYEFYWNTSPEKFTQKMYDNYKKFWNEERVKKASKIGLSPEEVGILASIVESETKKADEMPVVAGLYLNRLRKNIPLQADPTVVYATQLEKGVRSKRVYFKDLTINSPYNTYLYKGLPPGPILFPSKTALLSVLDAKEHSFLYMCADPKRPGYHLFTSDYQEHLRNAARYRTWVNSLNIN